MRLGNIARPKHHHIGAQRLQVWRLGAEGRRHGAGAGEPFGGLHDGGGSRGLQRLHAREQRLEDRKSTRLNSSHVKISYAVFCLKKKTASLPMKEVWKTK